METISRIEFDPIKASNGEFALSGRVILISGEERTIFGSGELLRPVQEQERLSQAILLGNVAKIYCKVPA